MKGLEALSTGAEHVNDDGTGQQMEQFHTDLALLKHKQHQSVNAAAVSAEWCEECGMEIPELRRKAVPGVELCVDCQRVVELSAKGYAHER